MSDMFSKLNSKISLGSGDTFLGYNSSSIRNKQNLKQQFSSNNTLMYFQGTNKPTYFLTAYVRAKVISISKISYQEMLAYLNCQIFIDISYRSISKEQKNQILKLGITLSFQTDKSLLLNRNNPDVTVYDNQGEKRLQFVIRKFVKSKLICDQLFWTPFQVINCQLAFRLNKVKIVKELEDNQNEHQTEFYFNLMDNQNTSLKITSSVDSNFGIFQIASAMLKAKYTTSFEKNPVDQTAQQKKASTNKLMKMLKKKKDREKNQNQKDIGRFPKQIEQLSLLKRNYGKQKLLAFNVALFQIPLYKKPIVANLTIFLPMFMLAVTNLGIFYQQVDLHLRIVSIAALMVAFVALVPVIREQIPPTSTISLVQYLVFSQALTTILALFDSLRLVDIADTLPQDFDFDGSQSALFIISLIITISIYVIIIALGLLYWLSWKPSYIDENIVEEDMKADGRLQIYEWSNKQCDQYFRKFYQAQSLSVREDNEEKNEIFVENILGIGLDLEGENSNIMMQGK